MPTCGIYFPSLNYYCCMYRYLGRALRHFMIAVKLIHKRGATKDDYAKALRCSQRRLDCIVERRRI